MRDAGRIREKIQIDSRQMVSIVLGAAVLLGIVFYLGVSVGRDLATAQAVASTDPLEQLDRKAELLAEKLTFPDALTDEAAPPMPSPEAAAAAKAETAKAAAREAAQAAQAQANENQAKAALEEADRAAARKAAADAEKAAAERTALAKAEAASAAKARAEAEAAGAAKARAEADAARRAAAPAAAPKPGTATGGFTVQVGAMPQRTEAEALVTRLRRQGLSPYIVEAEIPERGTFYRVRLGRFGSRDEAKRYLEDVQRETQLTGFVAQVDD